MTTPAVVIDAVVPTLESRFVGLATGQSGDIEIEREFLRTMSEQYVVFCQKQADYGRDNISAFGADGVMVRMWDKVARLVNLWRKKADPFNESVFDTWLDVANYGTIGLMCKKGRWNART